MQQTEKNQNPLVYYGMLMVYMFIAVIIRAAVVMPLGALFLFEKGNLLQWLSIITPVLFVFIVLPLRYSFAEAIAKEQGVRNFSLSKAFSFKDYTKKLVASLWHALQVLKWGIPLGLAIYIAFDWMKKHTMGELLNLLVNLGVWYESTVASVQNFFLKLFGSVDVAVPKGGLMDGVIILASMLVLLLIIWIFGIYRNSASRYLWVYARKCGENPTAYRRKALKHKRSRQLIYGLINLIIWVPCILMLLAQRKLIPDNIVTSLMTSIAMGKSLSLDWYAIVRSLAIGLLLLYMPFIPLRRIFTVVFVSGIIPSQEMK